MMHHTRRDFLKTVGLGMTSLGLDLVATPSELASSAPAFNVPVIDTHTHFYDPLRPQGVPWPPAEDKLLYRRVLPENYKKLVVPCQVTGTVVVEASAWEEDNQWILDLADQDKFIMGFVGHLTPNRPGFREQLRRFARQPLFRGIRIGGTQIHEELEQPGFIADLKLMADLNLELDVLIGTGQLAETNTLSKQVPELRIVIDHVANVRIDGKPMPPDWITGMRQVGKQRHVYCKVSGLVEGSGQTDGKAPTDIEFYRPAFDAIWQFFGEDRLIYGSNWPVSERFAPYPVVQYLVLEYFRTKGDAVLEKVFRRNAKTVYQYIER